MGIVIDVVYTHAMLCRRLRTRANVKFAEKVGVYKKIV